MTDKKARRAIAAEQKALRKLAGVFPLRKSKSRPGKSEAELSGVVISEATAREIEARAKAAGYPLESMVERLIVMALLTVPEDPDEWDGFVEMCTRARMGRR